MPTTSERLLVQQIRQGDARAWELVIAQFEGRLLAFVKRRLHDHAASEDVVQETLQGFLTSLPNFDERRELQTWLFTIASHKLTDYLRKQGRHPLQHVSDGPDDLLHQKLDLHSGASSQARGKERRELESAALAEALGKLLADWRARGEFDRIQVLELLFVKGLANKDVASQLRVSEQTVANIRFAAVKKLAEHVRSAGLSAAVFPELSGSQA
jgi:RNA polymerase sigma-70 factor (ECF subfamily)